MATSSDKQNDVDFLRSISKVFQGNDNARRLAEIADRLKAIAESDVGVEQKKFEFLENALQRCGITYAARIEGDQLIMQIQLHGKALPVLAS